MKTILLFFSVSLSFFFFKKENQTAVFNQKTEIATDILSPILNQPDSTFFWIPTGCERTISLLPKIEDESPFEDLLIRWKLDFYIDGRIDSEGLGILQTAFPIGKHLVHFTVIDPEGNQSSIDVLVEFQEENPRPYAVCFPDVSVDVFPSTCEVEIWAIDFDNGSYHCTSSTLNFFINRLEDSNNNGQIDPEEVETDPPFGVDTLLLSGITDLGTVFAQFWVIDTFGKTDYCLSTIEVRDNNNCGQSDAFGISGCAKTANGIAIDNVKFNVMINGGRIYPFIDSCFVYRSFSFNIDSVLITPSKEQYSTKDIDSLDFQAIAQHILNKNKITSPYKLIAADVDNSGSISVRDLVALRKFVSGKTTTFPNNRLWRFMPNNFQFSDPKNPWETPFPEIGNYDREVDSKWGKSFQFIGIQIGNVN